MADHSNSASNNDGIVDDSGQDGVDRIVALGSDNRADWIRRPAGRPGIRDDVQTTTRADWNVLPDGMESTGPAARKPPAAVDEGNFTATKTSLSAELADEIRTHFGIDWSQATYDQLFMPMYSGIAAMLKITSYYTDTDTNPIPQSVSEQAIYWATRYTNRPWSNAIDTYVNASTAVKSTCSSPRADIVFTVDGSGSVTSTNFDLVKSFIVQVVDEFDISQENVRIGLIQFSSSAQVEFNLTTYNSKVAVKAAIQDMLYLTGGTNSAAGLRLSEDMIQHEGRQEDGVPVITIFLTDGQSGDKQETEDAANDFHATLPQVTVFSVGVGSNPDTDELWTIASEPKCNHVFSLAGFDDISEFTDQIMKGACKAQAELSEGREVSGAVSEGQQYYFKIIAKRNEPGVRVELTSTSGGVKAYFSWRVQNPSEAVYDKMEEVSGGTKSIHIAWDTASVRAVSEEPLYGSIVGAEMGSNEFRMSYKDSALSHTAGLLSLIAACLVALLNNLH